MKLANPRTIQSNINEERRKDIDNGVQLARKVDNLREKLQDLETRHALFNEATTRELREKTEQLSQEIFSKELIIAGLEKERQELLKPFTVKWNLLEEKENDLKLARKDLESFRLTLTEHKQELDSREKSLSLDEERYSELKKQIDKQADKVSKASLEAQSTLLEARKLEKDTMLTLKKEKAKVTNKLKQVELREQNVKQREEKLEEEEQNIINIKIQLADQRATLERALARIN